MASTATPTDVRGVIETELTDSEIQSFLDDASGEIDDTVDADLTTEQRTRLEKYYAAYLIRDIRDRQATHVRQGSAKLQYEGTGVDALRRMVQRLDPSGRLVAVVHRNRSRHITSTTDE